MGTNHLREPSGSLIRRHMLKMTPGATAVFVTPEQRPWVVKIVSRDNAVLGGGLIHVVGAVSAVTHTHAYAPLQSCVCAPYASA